MTSPSRHAVFDAPARYKIRVSGRFDPGLTASLGGMVACVDLTPGSPPETTLLCSLTDQAGLLGVLTELYDMGYALLELRRLAEQVAG